VRSTAQTASISLSVISGRDKGICIKTSSLKKQGTNPKKELYRLQPVNQKHFLVPAAAKQSAFCFPVSFLSAEIRSTYGT
jgi:hypothetical protein